MTIDDYFTDELRILFCGFSIAEKECLDIIIIKDVKQFRRRSGIRAIVKSKAKDFFRCLQPEKSPGIEPA
jgi:hypothetical protein